MQEKIVFVILNYNTARDTIECIASIENHIDITGYRIIIVDNNSSDDSVEVLLSYSKDREDIELIQNDENVGFARGNNIGLKKALEYDPEFIVALNSDTLLVQNYFYKNIEDIYKKEHFGLLGPLILTANGHCDNSPHFPPTQENVKKEIRTFKFERLFIRIGLYKPFRWTLNLSNMFIRFVDHRKISHKNMEYFYPQSNVVVQGCFLIFSNKGLKQTNGFDERTFLYYEEPILYLRMKKSNQKVVFDPRITIYHKEGAATDKVGKTSRKRMLFINKCYLDSAKVLLDCLEEYE